MDTNLDQPVVSIIIPVYNNQDFISEAIDSVLIQTYSKWDLVIIDDGSTDNTKQIVFKYSTNDSRIRYYYQQNKGQAAARNIGISNSKGKFIAFLDADDVWIKDKIEVQLKTLVKFNADLVFSNAGYFSDSNKVTINQLSQKGALDERGLFKDLFQRSSIANSSVLLKRDILSTVGLFDESPELRGTEDWDLWLRIAQNNYKFYGIERILIKYRIHDGGTHMNKIKMFHGKLAIQDKYRFSREVPRWIKLKQYRYVFRELINYIYKEENEQKKIAELLTKFIERDNKGLCTKIQFALHKRVSSKNFFFLSNAVLYRIFYRLENLTYVFLSLVSN